MSILTSCSTQTQLWSISRQKATDCLLFVQLFSVFLTTPQSAINGISQEIRDLVSETVRSLSCSFAGRMRKVIRCATGFGFLLLGSDLVFAASRMRRGKN